MVDVRSPRASLLPSWARSEGQSRICILHDPISRGDWACGGHQVSPCIPPPLMGQERRAGSSLHFAQPDIFREAGRVLDIGSPPVHPSSTQSQTGSHKQEVITGTPPDFTVEKHKIMGMAD